MPVCVKDNIELPATLMFKCEHCGKLYCVRHIREHHVDINMTFRQVPKMMRKK